MTLALVGLSVALPRGGHLVPVLQDISLSVAPGEILAIVGESGSGKTTAALAILKLLPPGASFAGRILLDGEDIAPLPEAAMRRRRGARIGMVFQDPLAALNPVLTVGAQIAEPIRVHEGASRPAAWARAVDLLAEVGMPEPAARAREFPHMLSGGMRQRAMIAAALACGPGLLIADEPTSGLDAALAADIFALLARLRAARGLAVLLISHDFAVVGRHADRIAVFYAGHCVETGPAAAVLRAPLHRYTRALLAAAPGLDGTPPTPIAGTLPEPEAWPPGCRFAPRCTEATMDCGAAPPVLGGAGHAASCLHPGAGPAATRSPAARPKLLSGGEVLRAERLTVRYGGGVFDGPARLAVADAGFSLTRGACLGVVGASGSGKTTLARAVAQMVPYDGQVMLRGQHIGALRGAAMRVARRRIQMVFQNPAGSLDPLQTVGAAIREALALAGDAREGRAEALLDQVGLPAALLRRYPATLSGGQAQRAAIARALAADPDVLLLDEPTASLDVSTAAGLLCLLRDLAGSRGLAYIVITHDLAAAAFLAHRLAVMQGGRVVETGETAALLHAPTHPCTQALVAAARA